MNKTFRLVWREATGEWLVASEHAQSRGKRSSRAIRRAAVLFCGLLAAQPALAAPPIPSRLPTGGQVVAGQATISQSGAALTVNQGTAKAIVNWQSFSIGSNASVNFVQPSASSVALNRVLGSDPSAIYGRLTANGQVFLVNPNGVLFGPGARVDVGGLVATTMNIRNDDFLAGQYRFFRDGGTGSVVNQGEIAAKYVALLAPEVRNEGVVTAPMGTVALAAGEAVTLGITGNSLITVQVEKATVNTLVENRHLIQVDGGTAMLAALSVHSLLGSVVNSGAVEANGVQADGGTIRLTASSAIAHSGSLSANAGANGRGGSVIAIADLSNAASRTTVSGVISARGGAESGDGGFIETSARKLTIESGARVDTRAPNGKTGQWLLDPDDFTIAASGGDITGSDLAAALATTSVTIETGDNTTGGSCAGVTCGTLTAGNGDIFVNDAVTWNSANTLTLKAWRDINLNAKLTLGTGSVGAVALHYGLGDIAAVNYGFFNARSSIDLADTARVYVKRGSNGTLDQFSVVNSASSLSNIATNLAGKYVLGSDIDLASWGNWTPLGTLAGTRFTGVLEGAGHVIKNLQHASANEQWIGLFGAIDNGGLVQNLGLVKADVAGLYGVGALTGRLAGTIINSWSTGKVKGEYTAGGDLNVGAIGGLVGLSSGGFIRQGRSSATVTATTGTQVDGDGLNGGIGGLVGVQTGGGTYNSHATGSVTGKNEVGGLIGMANGDVHTGYANGAVSITADAAIATPKVGGLLGNVGAVSDNTTNLSHNFWNTTTSGQVGSGGSGASKITGLTTAQMETAANFTSATADNGTVNPGWSTRFWTIANGAGPKFKGVPDAPLTGAITINLANKTRTYGDTAQPTLTGFSITGTPLTGDSFTGANWGTALTDYLAAGTYGFGTVNLISPVFSSTTGHTVGDYDINWTGSLVVNAKALTVSGLTVANKVYDSTTAASGSGAPTLDGVVNSDLVFVTGIASNYTFANKDVGTGKTVNFTGLSLTGTGTGNYTLTQTASADITKANLAVTGLAASNKVYDTGILATLTGTAAVTALGTDVVTVGGIAAGTFTDKNAGTGKAVNVTGNTLGGGDAGNYNIVQQSLTANITKANLAVTGLAAGNRVYDATQAATLTGTASVTPLGTDAVSVNGAATGMFADKNVGTGKAVTVTGSTLTGSTDVGNYNIVQQTGLTADITKANLAVTGLAASNKVYDTGIVATLTGTAAVTALGTDVVTVGGIAGGTFVDKNAGNGKTVTVTGNTLGGGDAGNYNIVQQTGLIANITKANLAVTGLATGNKVYNGSTAATLTGTASVTPLGTDAVSVFVTVGGIAAGTFVDKNAGTGKAVTVTDHALDGGDAGNYNIVQQTGLTANITQANLTLGGSRAYDGSTTVAGSVLTATGVNSETFSMTGSGSVASKDANATPQALNTLGTLVLGSSPNNGLAGNYNALATTGSAVTINQKAISVLGLTSPQPSTFLTPTLGLNFTNSVTLTGTPTTAAPIAAGTGTAADGKPYNVDGPFTFTGTAGASNWTVTNVSTKAVSAPVTGLSHSGTGAGNYTLTGTSVSSTIKPNAEVTAAAYIAFVTVPSFEVANVVFSVSPIVRVFDKSGNVVTTYTRTVNLSGFDLRGPRAVAFINGEARFSALFFPAGGTKTLRADSGVLTSVSPSIIVQDTAAQTAAVQKTQTQSTSFALKLNVDASILNDPKKVQALKDALKTDMEAACGCKIDVKITLGAS